MDLPDVTEKVRLATIQIVDEHVAELDEALAIQLDGIARHVTQQFIEGICDKLGDPKWKLEIRSIAQQPTPNNQTDIAHTHAAVERLFYDVTTTVTNNLQSLATVTKTACESHFKVVSVPRFTAEYSSLLAEEQHRMADQMNRRVRYFTADHEISLAMMANHEIKALSPYLNTLLVHAKSGGGGSLVDMVTANGGVGLASSNAAATRDDTPTDFDAVLQLSRLEDDIQALMKPAVLRKMSADRAKAMLLECMAREKANWKEFERVQQILNHNARKEEKEREVFRTNLLASVQNETAALNDKVNCLSHDLQEGDEKRAKVEVQRDESLEVLSAVDSWCVSLTAEVEFLLAVAQKNGIPTRETERVAQYLSTVGDRYRAVNLAEPYKWLRDHIRTNPATIPNAVGNDLTTEMLQAQTEVLRGETQLHRAEAEVLRVADALRKETVKGIHTVSLAHKERLEYEAALTQTQKKLRDENRYLKTQNQKLSTQLEQVENPRTLYDVPQLTQDLARKLQDAERRIKFGLGASSTGAATSVEDPILSHYYSQQQQRGGIGGGEEEAAMEREDMSNSGGTEDEELHSNLDQEPPRSVGESSGVKLGSGVIPAPTSPVYAPSILAIPLSTAAVRRHHHHTGEPLTKPPRPPASSSIASSSGTPRNTTPEVAPITIDNPPLDAASPLVPSVTNSIVVSPLSSPSSSRGSSVVSQPKNTAATVKLQRHWIEATVVGKQHRKPIRPISSSGATRSSTVASATANNVSNGGGSTWTKTSSASVPKLSPRVYTLSDDPLLINKPHSTRPYNPVRWQLKVAQQVLAQASSSSQRGGGSVQPARPGSAKISPRTPRPPGGCLQR